MTGPRKVIVLHMVYPDGTHTGDCAGCRWDQGLCAICGDDHQPRCRDRRDPGDPEWTARELMSGLRPEDDNDEPCMCETDFTCIADDHSEPVR